MKVKIIVTKAVMTEIVYNTNGAEIIMTGDPITEINVRTWRKIITEVDNRVIWTKGTIGATWRGYCRVAWQLWPLKSLETKKIRYC